MKKNFVAENSSISDAELATLIFNSGFNTTDTDSDISGRGYGMDIIRHSLQSHSGTIKIEFLGSEAATKDRRKPFKFIVQIPGHYIEEIREFAA